MVEGGREVAVVGEEENDAVRVGVQAADLACLSSLRKHGVVSLFQEWVLQSPLHLAAYVGDLARLQETLKDSKHAKSHVLALQWAPALFKLSSVALQQL